MEEGKTGPGAMREMLGYLGVEVDPILSHAGDYLGWMRSEDRRGETSASEQREEEKRGTVANKAEEVHEEEPIREHVKIGKGEEAV